MQPAAQRDHAERLGEVSTGRSDTLRVPRGIDPTTGDFQLLIDPVGSTYAYTTQNILLSPGDKVILTVGNNLNQTTVRTVG